MTTCDVKWKVLVSAPYLLPDIHIYREELRRQGIELIPANVKERLSESELLPLVGSIDGVICGDDRFTQKVFDAAPKLKVIAKWGTGIDSIDLEAAKSAGVTVYNTPGAFTHPVADTVLGYILMFARQLHILNQDMQRNEWVKRDAVSLRECVLGIIGVGEVGKAVAYRAKAFGMGLLGCDPIRMPPEFLQSTGIEMVTLEDLLKRSDFVTLHCTLNPTSQHIINSKNIDLIKETAYLINTCRGPVVEESALSNALNNNTIGGAALDVFEEEPLPSDSLLRGLSNCFLAPHNANSSPDAWVKVHQNTIKCLIEGLLDA